MISYFKDNYKTLAYKNADIKEANWNPRLGFKANEEIMHKVYVYYQKLYFKCPEKFLWLGLARLTGGQVLWGMQNLCKLAKDPCEITCHIVAIAKDIFEDLAWQHELFLAEPLVLLELLQQGSQNQKHFSALTIWSTLYHETDFKKWSEVNLQQLHNEQLETVQPHYDLMKLDAYSRKFLWLTRFTMRNIHPHHRRFIVDVPFKDVTEFKYRWRWISAPKGMWATWVELSQEERNRLVRLSNEEVIYHRW